MSSVLTRLSQPAFTATAGPIGGAVPLEIGDAGGARPVEWQFHLRVEALSTRSWSRLVGRRTSMGDIAEIPSPSEVQMTDVRTFLVQATLLCLQAVGLAWLLAAGYFALRVPGSWRTRTGHFLRTLLPEPWLLLAGPAVGVLLRLTPHAIWQHLTFWNPVLAVAGFAIVLGSTALMLWARWVLGRMWAGRPLVLQGHELCTSGPYRLVRHPIYAGIVGLALGGTLVAGFAQMLVVLAATIAFAAWRVRTEDRIMIATFGDQYRAYRSRVRALLPIAH